MTGWTGTLLLPLLATSPSLCPVTAAGTGEGSLVFIEEGAIRTNLSLGVLVFRDHTCLLGA